MRETQAVADVEIELIDKRRSPEAIGPYIVGVGEMEAMIYPELIKSTPEWVGRDFPGSVLRVEIVKLYIRPAPSTVEAVAVLGVSWLKHEGAEGEYMLVRGQVANNLWASVRSELRAALRQAVRKAMADFWSGEMDSG